MSRPNAGDVRETFGAARQHADALSGPPQAWTHSRSFRAPSGRQLGAALLLLAAGSASAYYGWARIHPEGDLASVDALLRDAPPGAGMPPPTPPWATVLQSPPPGAAAVPALAPAPAGPLTMAVRGAGLITIEFSQTTLGDAVAALARASGTTVHGGAALPAFEPVNLHWRGASPEQAWEQLLGRYASTAVSCGPSACGLWIVGIKPRPPGSTVATGVAPSAQGLSVSTAASPAPAPTALGMTQPSPVRAPTPAPIPASEAPVEPTETN